MKQRRDFEQLEAIYMDDKLFASLLESIQEVKDIESGKKTPKSITKVEVLDVKAIRQKTGLTQEMFAKAICCSRDAVQSWESFRRSPTGPTRQLLKLIEMQPALIAQLS